MVSVMRVLIALGMVLGLQLVAVRSASADDSNLTQAGKEGLQQISTCLRSNPNLVALLVVDESGSLQDTDPDNRRADVLADLVLSLGQLSGQPTPQGPRRVEFAVNLFAFESEALVPWTTLDEGSASRIADDIRTNLPSRNEGQATNYESALTSARSSMAQGVDAIGGSSQPCQIVFWFTDGVLVVGDEQANQASAQRLCAPDGPVDALRRSGIHLISVLLFDRSKLDEFTQEAQETLKQGIPLLQATAEGSGGSGQYETTCGTEPIPANAARGAFFEGNVDALAGQFTQALALGSGGTDGPDLNGTPVSFVIDPGFTRFWVTAIAPDGFELTSPQGETITGTPGSDSETIAGTQADITWTGVTFTAKVPVTAAGIGEWILARPGMEDQVNVYLFSDYTLVVEPTEFVADEEVTIQGRVIDVNGNPADLTVFQSADLSVTQTVDGAVVDPVPFELSTQDGTFVGTFTPRSNSTEIQFDLTLQLVSSSGTPLAPLTTTFIQQVKLPGGYPQIAETALDLGSVKNRGDVASSTLNITGSPDGPTEVCVLGINPSTFVQGADLSLSTNADSGCIQLGPNETRTIDVSALLGSGVADGGQVVGDVVLSVKNAPSADLPETRERELKVPFSVQVIPVDPLLWVPIALTILGIAIPLAALYILNWRAARLKLDGLMVARVPVLVNVTSDQPLKRADENDMSLLGHDDFSFAPVTNGRARTWQSGGTETLRGRAPKSPFGSVRAEVKAPPGFTVMSNEVPTTSSNATSAGVGLNPSMSAYVLIPESEFASAEGDWLSGEIVAYLVPDNLATDAARLSAQLSTHLGWSPAARELRNAVINQSPVTTVIVDDPDTPGGFESSPPSVGQKAKFGFGDDAAQAQPPAQSGPDAPPSSTSSPQPPEPPTGGSGKNKFSLD